MFIKSSESMNEKSTYLTYLEVLLRVDVHADEKMEVRPNETGLVADLVREGYLASTTWVGEAWEEDEKIRLTEKGKHFINMCEDKLSTSVLRRVNDRELKYCFEMFERNTNYYF